MEAALQVGEFCLLCAALLHIGLTWAKALQKGRHPVRPNHPQPPSTSTSWPSVSVLVPAWKEASVIQGCLDALYKTHYPDWEIIVIAGGDDRTYETAVSASRANGSVLKQEPRGKNAALNQGLATARGQVIVILDADTLVAPDWLTCLIEPIQSGSAAVCGNYFPIHETWISLEEQMEKISNYLIHRIIILQGSGTIAIKRDILEAVGGFPEDVKVGVDWDLDARVSKQDFQKAFAETARVRTHRPSTLADYWKNEIRWRRAHLHSIWVRRNWFLRSPKVTLSNLIFYIVALAPLVGLLLALGSFILGWREIAAFFLWFFVIFLVWVVGRRAALAGEVASFTANRFWLKSAWVPGTLLLVSIAASWLAMLTFYKPVVHFKGPRH